MSRRGAIILVWIFTACVAIVVAAAVIADTPLNYGEMNELPRGVRSSAALSSGGIVSYDTVTVLVCGIETFAYSGGAGWDAGDHKNPEWPQTAPDVVLIDADGTYLRYAETRYDTPTAAPGGSEAARFVSYVEDEAAFPAAIERNCIMWVDLDTIPAGAKIINAEICFYMDLNTPAPANSWYAAFTDTIASDIGWVSAPLYSGNNRDRQTSWNEMNVVSHAAWSPALADRTTFAQMGIAGVRSIGQVLADNPITFNVTESLQYVLDNDLYCGWWFKGDTQTAATILRFKRQNIGVSTEANEQPFVKITYTTANYRGPWPGGKSYAVVFTTDDTHDSNKKYVKCFQDRAAARPSPRYQMFCSGWHVDGLRHTMENYLSAAEIKAYRNGATVDVASHTWTHYSTGADEAWRRFSLAGIIAEYGEEAGTDTLRQELDSGWLSEMLGCADTDIESVAYPSCSYSDAIIALMQSEFTNYTSGRTCGSLGKPVYWYSGADSMYCVGINGGAWTAGQHPILGQGLSAGQVAAALDSALVANGHGVPLVILTHGDASSSYSEADTAQIGFMLDRGIERGDVAFISFDQMVETFQAMHTTTDNITWEWGW